MKEDGQYAKFYKVFLNKFYPEFEQIEIYRKGFRGNYIKELFKQGIPLVLCFAIFMLVLGFSYLIFSHDIQFSFIILLLGAYFFYYFLSDFNNLKTDYDKRYKDYLKQKFGTRFLEVFNDSDIMKFKRFSSDTDDSFCGKYNDVGFRVTDYGIVDKFDKDRKVEFEFDFNKNISENVEIISKKEILSQKIIVLRGLIFVLAIAAFFLIFELLFILVGLIGCCAIFKIIKTHKKRKNNEAVLEDLNFNKRFSVYSNNQVEARYVCTTAFMDRLYNLKTAFKAQRIKCTFYNEGKKSKLKIQMYTKKDLFELGDINKPIYKDTSIYDFYGEIDSIFRIIDALKLDRKTGL